MKIPKGMTEAEVLKIIHEVSLGLARKYIFGYHTLEDMKQQAKLEAIKGLESFDPSRGVKLKTFLWTVVNNSLFNFKRDNFQRPDLPCLKCPLKAYDPHFAKSSNQCTAYKNKHDCEPFDKWYKRNNAKKNVMSPISMTNVRDEHEETMKIGSTVERSCEYNNVIEIIDNKIPVNLRKLWIKMKQDIKLCKSDREKLLAAIREIMSGEEYGT